MKTASKLFAILLLISLIGCSKEDDSVTTPPVAQETQKSSEKKITRFVFNSEDNAALSETVTATINEIDKTISAIVPYGADITAFTPIITASDKASVSPTGAQDFSAPVAYTITAEDNSKTTYTVTITPALNTEKAILSFVFMAEQNAALIEDITATIDHDENKIMVTVPFLTKITELLPVIELSPEASITPNSPQDFSSPVDYTITAQDGTTATYTVTVALGESNEKQILGFAFSPDENSGLSEYITTAVDEVNKTITAVMPLDVDLTTLIPSIQVTTNATINPTGVQDFTNPITYTVTAQDGSSIDYEVSLKFSEKDVLIAIFNANPNNTLDWVFSEPDLNNWTGVTTNANGDITKLSLINKGLNFLPPEIGNLTQLSELAVSINQLTEIPIEIGNLTNLKRLYLNKNLLAQIPSEIGNLTNLTVLYLYENQLSEIPLQIGQLISLDQLDIHKNNLTHIPSQIGNLTELDVLRLDRNRLTVIPSQIGNLTNLRSLWINENQLGILVPEIGNLTNLKQLLLDFNQLTKIPSEIGNLTNLTTLRIDHNQLSMIPPELVNLTNLRKLSVRNNSLSQLPDWIGQLPNLTQLLLDNNSLTGITPQIGKLTDLEQLWLSHNKLSQIPVEMAQLIKLTNLALFGNNLVSIPQAICDLNIQNLQLDAGVICK